MNYSKKYHGDTETTEKAPIKKEFSPCSPCLRGKALIFFAASSPDFLYAVFFSLQPMQTEVQGTALSRAGLISAPHIVQTP